jgi:hypothetical protein
MTTSTPMRDAIRASFQRVMAIEKARTTADCLFTEDTVSDDEVSEFVDDEIEQLLAKFFTFAADTLADYQDKSQ